MSFEPLCSALQTHDFDAVEAIIEPLVEKKDSAALAQLLTQTDDQNRNAFIIAAKAFTAAKTPEKEQEWTKIFCFLLEKARDCIESHQVQKQIFSQVDNEGFNFALSVFKFTGTSSITMFFSLLTDSHGSALAKLQLAQKTKNGETALSLITENPNGAAPLREPLSAVLQIFNLFTEQYALLTEDQNKQLEGSGVSGADWKCDEGMAGFIKDSVKKADEKINSSE